LKGEFVLIVAGAQVPAATSVDTDRLLVALAEHMPGKVAARIIADATGEKRNALYQRLLELGANND
jgi:16S rRNA (cytidine1402-2'-O)-methyltransferase